MISPVTDEDVENIRAAAATCKDFVAQQLNLRNVSSVMAEPVEKRIAMTDEEILEKAVTVKPERGKKKKKRAHRQVAA